MIMPTLQAGYQLGLFGGRTPAGVVAPIAISSTRKSQAGEPREGSCRIEHDRLEFERRAGGSSLWSNKRPPPYWVDEETGGGDVPLTLQMIIALVDRLRPDLSINVP
jgi:hypothetical protein